MIGTAGTHRLYLIKFCAFFSRLSSPSISITDTVSYLISYLLPLYIYAYGWLTRICIGKPCHTDPRTPPFFFPRSFSCFQEEGTAPLFLYFHTCCILWMTQMTFDGRFASTNAKNSGDWRFKVDAFLVVQALCRKEEKKED